MINSIAVLIFTIIVSFLGSLQLGPVNLSVIRTTLTSSIRQAKWVAFGGVVPEIIYSFLALQISSISGFSDSLLNYKWLVGAFFIVIGVYYFFKPKVKQNNVDLKPTKVSGFFSGFYLALLNLQLLPFWIGVSVSINNSSFFSITSVFDKFSFIFGSAIGAFLLLLLLINLTSVHKNRILLLLENFNLNRIFGVLFVILGFIQFI
jgi:threonine/homoserine/homoserine lactone efflux protein